MKTHVNLMSPQFIERETFKDIIRKWMMIAALAMLGAIAWSGWQYQSSRSTFARRSVLRQTYARHQQDIADLQTLQAQMQALVAQQQTILHLSAEPSLLSLLGIVSAAGAKGAGAIYLEQLDYRNVRQVATPASDTASIRSLFLKGIAKDNLAVARFADEIRGAPVFKSVELQSTGALSPDVSAPYGQTFSIQCSLWEPRLEVVR